MHPLIAIPLGILFIYGFLKLVLLIPYKREQSNPVFREYHRKLINKIAQNPQAFLDALNSPIEKD